MLSLGILLLSLLSVPNVAPSTGTGCNFNIAAWTHERSLITGEGSPPKLSKRCRRILDIQRWVASMR